MRTVIFAITEFHLENKLYTHTLLYSEIFDILRNLTLSLVTTVISLLPRQKALTIDQQFRLIRQLSQNDHTIVL